MRALFCLKGPNEINGPNVWLLRHLPLLRRHGIEPRVLYVAPDPDEPCRFVTALEAQGIGARRVRLGRFTEDDVPAIVEAIAADAPDVFVPNYTAAAYYACAFARQAGIRTIGTIHSDDPYYHDILDVFVRGEEAWRLDGVVTVSDYLDTCAREAATPGTRVLQATYGAPTPVRYSTAPGGDDLTLIYVGRLVERQKRVRRVAERMCDATRRVARVQAVLYGEGPERAYLENALAADQGHRVRLGGALSPESMMPTLARAHALVLLSDFEGLSIALMEAMACGVVPILADMRSGTADLAQHEINALIVDPDDEASVTAAVRRLREEPGLWERLSAAARRTITEKGYTSDECAAQWARFCHELVADTRARPLVPPRREELALPPRCQRVFGLRIGDRRDPWHRLRRVASEGRAIYVWGAGSGGQQFLATQAAGTVDIAGVIDRLASERRWTIQGVPVYPPARLDEARRDSASPFVVITSMYEDEIGRTLEALGFRNDVDFVSA